MGPCDQMDGNSLFVLFSWLDLQMGCAGSGAGLRGGAFREAALPDRRRSRDAGEDAAAATPPCHVMLQTGIT